MWEDSATVLTKILLLVAHYNLLLLLLFDSLHILLELLLIAHRLPIWEGGHLVVVLAFQLLGSANVCHATIVLITFIEEAIMGRLVCARLLLECILCSIDNGHIFE